MTKTKRKSLSGDYKKKNERTMPSSFNRNRDLPSALRSCGSSFSIILQTLLYKKPILPGEDADYLMRQSQPRIVDRRHWRFTY